MAQLSMSPDKSIIYKKYIESICKYIDIESGDKGQEIAKRKKEEMDNNIRKAEEGKDSEKELKSKDGERGNNESSGTIQGLDKMAILMSISTIIVMAISALYCVIVF